MQYTRGIYRCQCGQPLKGHTCARKTLLLALKPLIGARIAKQLATKFVELFFVIPSLTHFKQLTREELGNLVEDLPRLVREKVEELHSSGRGTTLVEG